MRSRSEQKSIDIVRNMFKDAQESGCLHNVWTLVSAIRGPDDENSILKEKYTTQIRAMLIDCGMAYTLGVSDHEYYPSVFPDYLPLCPEYNGEESMENEHFVSHARLAWRLLQNNDY